MASKQTDYAAFDFQHLMPKRTDHSRLSLLIGLVLILILLSLMAAAVWSLSGQDRQPCSQAQCTPSVTINTEQLTAGHYSRDLASQQQRLRAQLKQAVPEGTTPLENQWRYVQQSAVEIQTNYLAYLDQLVTRIQRLTAVHQPEGSEALDDAAAALADGNLSLATQTLELVVASERVPKAMASESHYQLCRMALDAGRFARAFQACQSAVRLVPDNPLYLYWTARAAQWIGYYPQAKFYLGKAMALPKPDTAHHPRLDRDMLFLLGEVAMAMGRYEDAIDHFHQALVMDLKYPNTPVAQLAQDRLRLSEAWSRVGGIKTAIQYGELALAQDSQAVGEQHPKTIDDYRQLGALWASRKNNDKALFYYEKALKISIDAFGPVQPDSADLYSRLGQVWLAMGQYENAAGYFRRALGVQQQLYMADHHRIAATRRQLGEIWHNIGEYDKAVSHFEAALTSHQRTDPDNLLQLAEDHGKLAAAWSAMGRDGDAIPHYEQALVLYHKLGGATDSRYQQTKRALYTARHRG